MKKELIVSAIVILLIGIGLVSAVQTENEVSIQKGWNLIPFNSFRAISANGDIQISNFQYGYLYHPIEKKYLLAWNNGDWTDTIKNLASPQGNPASLTSASLWVYSDKAGTMKIWSEGDGDVSQFRFESGWNFMYAIPAMNGLTLNDIKGTCSIENAYFWNTKVYSGHNEASWEKIYIDETKFNQQTVGYGFIIKVADDCTLSSSGTVTPPAIPQITDTTNQNIVTCIDSDGGANYYAKGNTTGLNVYNQSNTATDYCVYAGQGGYGQYLQSGQQAVMEYLCSSDGVTMNDDLHVCPKGCSNGACVP